MHDTPRNAEAAPKDGLVTPSTTWWMRWVKVNPGFHHVKNPSVSVFGGRRQGGHSSVPYLFGISRWFVHQPAKGNNR